MALTRHILDRNDALALDVVAWLNDLTVLLEPDEPCSLALRTYCVWQGNARLSDAAIASP
jgi:hypothetical protein